MITAGGTKQENMRDMATGILGLIGSGNVSDNLIIEIIMLIQEKTRIESVGLRLADGPDFPYYFTHGFDQKFVQKEMHLCARDQAGELIRDSKGNPVIECMCGNVICGRTDPRHPYFSEGGSYWSNCTTDLLASTSEENRQSRTRNRCNGEGYESVALIPIKANDKCLGLLQLNDRRKGMYTAEFIKFMEGVTINIGLLFSMSKMQAHLKSQAVEVSRSAIYRGELLSRLAKELRKAPDFEVTAGNKSNVLSKIDKLLDEVETLKGILPICMHCKKVRDKDGYWETVEKYISEHSHAEFSHSICEDCIKKFYPEFHI